MPGFSLLAATLADTPPAQAQWTLADGSRVRWHGCGALELAPADTPALSLLLSAGVHGNETAPLEILDALLDDLLGGRQPCRVRLLILFGNPPAMRTGQRYLDHDMNRLFSGRHRAADGHGREGRRAAELETLASRFFDSAGPARLHLDLHTAIRGSAIEQFAICPHHPAGDYDRARFDWLADAGIGAILLHSAPTGTFSHYTHASCGADAYTLELGKARPFGQNDLGRFARIADALARLVCGMAPLPAGNRDIPLFRARYDIIRHSDAFRMHLEDSVENFTLLADGQLIAEDGTHRYVAKGTEERILFPNPRVANGLRAGIVVAPVRQDQAGRTRL